MGFLGHKTNLIVISDLHLGDGHNPDRPEAFAKWLDHHRENPRGERKWGLVLNGDTFEFLHLSNDGNDGQFSGPPSARNACAKLQKIQEESHAAFAGLARFVLDGHQLHFVVGNHDRELMLRSVRKLLRRMLAHIAGVSRRHRRGFFKRIVFHPWFYFEPGKVYVEHGNQFDEYSSYTDVLSPNVDESKASLEEPVSHLAARTFVQRAPKVFDLDNVDYWGFIQYIQWGLRQSISVIVKLLSLYFITVFQLVKQAWNRVPFARVPSPKVFRVMQGHMVRYGVSWKHMTALRELWRPPARVWSVMRCFLIDRFLLMGLSAIAVGLFIGFLGLSWWNLLAIPVVLMLTVAAWMLLTHFRDLDVASRMIGMAERVRHIMNVPIVVFGHSHVTDIRPMRKEGCWYLNPGGWPKGSNSPGFFVLERRPDGSLVVGTVHAPLTQIPS